MTPVLMFEMELAVNVQQKTKGKPLIYDLGRPFTAHDVRKLRLCEMCGRLGYLPQMLTLDSKNYHGGCLVQTMTHEQVLALPPEQISKLRLNETGVELMTKLLDQTDSQRDDS